MLGVIWGGSGDQILGLRGENGQNDGFKAQKRCNTAKYLN